MQRGNQWPAGLVLAILGLLAGFLWDRVSLAVADAHAASELIELRTTLQEVRQRQFKNEDKIKELEMKLQEHSEGRR